MVQILFEDPHVIVVKKPPNQPSVDDQTGDLSLLQEIKHHLQQGGKVQNPYVAAIHRLDRPVGGVMVYAKTKLAAGTLSEALKAKDFSKKYYALVTGGVPSVTDTLVDYLHKDAKNVSHVVSPHHKDAKEAILKYTCIKQVADVALLQVELMTGRHHQIRVQLSHHGMPIVGDRKYGPPVNRGIKGLSYIGLYAYQLSFTHPKTQKLMTFEAQPIHGPFQAFFVE